MIEDRSDKERSLLFRHVCDLFFHGPLPESPAERQSLVDVLHKLRSKTPLTVRRELAGHLYSMDHPPETLIRVALEDVPEVSAAILKFAKIPASVLKDIARSRDTARITTLLARPDIATEFSDILSKTAADTEPTFEIKSPDILPDLTPLKESVGNAYTRKDQFNDFSRASSDWRWETDRNWVITYLSEAAQGSLGPTSNGIKITDLFRENSELESRLGHWRPFDNLIVTSRPSPAGEQKWCLSAVPNFDPYDGRFLGFRGSAKLETSPRLAHPATPKPRIHHHPAQAPTHTIETGLYAGVTDALQTLSHEIRTPLNAILGFSELIELGPSGPVNDDYRTCVRKIQAAGHHLHGFISEILEDARAEPMITPSVRTAHSQNLVKGSIDSLQRHAALRGIQIKQATSSADGIVMTDSSIAERCLQRLLRSAISDAPDNSTILIHSQHLADGSLQFTIPLEAPSRPPETDENSLHRLRNKQIERLAAHIGGQITFGQSALILRLPDLQTAREAKLSVACG